MHVVVYGVLIVVSYNSLLLLLGATALGSAYFGPGTGAINMDNVFCSGSEEQLTDCTFSETHNCAHSEDASVICVDTQCK